MVVCCVRTTERSVAERAERSVAMMIEQLRAASHRALVRCARHDQHQSAVLPRGGSATSDALKPRSLFGSAKVKIR